jgi:hypothetical protein
MNTIAAIAAIATMPYEEPSQAWGGAGTALGVVLLIILISLGIMKLVEENWPTRKK